MNTLDNNDVMNNDNHATVSFHDFKSQNFKLSVSNPKNKYVDYLSVLSQISNCQSLGRTNKHEILKTDRMTVIVDSLTGAIPVTILKTDRSNTNICIYIYIYTYYN